MCGLILQELNNIIKARITIFNQQEEDMDDDEDAETVPMIIQKMPCHSDEDDEDDIQPATKPVRGPINQSADQ